MAMNSLAISCRFIRNTSICRYPIALEHLSRRKFDWKGRNAQGTQNESNHGKRRTDVWFKQVEAIKQWKRRGSERDTHGRWFHTNRNDEKIVYALLVVNGVVFAMWVYPSEQLNKHRQWMLDNFTISLRNLHEGRYWTVVTHAFSQMQPMHLLLNMLGLYVFGTALVHTIGGKRLMTVYMIGGLAGAVAHILWLTEIRPALIADKLERLRYKISWEQQRLLKRTIREARESRRDIPANGASAAIMAFTVIQTLISPSMTWMLYGIIPVRAWLITGALVSYDVFGVIQLKNDSIGHAAHLGGAIFGAIYYFMFVRRKLLHR